MKAQEWVESNWRGTECYVIETGIPVPERTRGGSKSGAPRRAMTPWTQTLDRLEPGQSVHTDAYDKMKAASQFRMQRPEKQYVCRKVPTGGWRVWRTA